MHVVDIQLQRLFRTRRMLRFLITFVTITKVICLIQLKTCKEETLTDHICKVQEEYDKNKVPGDPPQRIDYLYNIHDIIDVNEKHSTMTILLGIDVRWVDRNLGYKPNKTYVYYLDFWLGGYY